MHEKMSRHTQDETPDMTDLSDTPIGEATDTEEETPDTADMEEDELPAAESGTGRRMSEKFARLTEAGSNRYRLTGMYKDWFLDYATRYLRVPCRMSKTV